MTHYLREVISLDWLSNIMRIWWADDCPVSQFRTHTIDNGLEQTDREDLWNMYGWYSHCREDTRAVTLRHSFREVVSWVSNIMWIWWVDDCPIAQYRTYTVDTDWKLSEICHWPKMCEKGTKKAAKWAWCTYDGNIVYSYIHFHNQVLRDN